MVWHIIKFGIGIELLFLFSFKAIGEPVPNKGPIQIQPLPWKISVGDEYEYVQEKLKGNDLTDIQQLGVVLCKTPNSDNYILFFGTYPKKLTLQAVMKVEGTSYKIILPLSLPKIPSEILRKE